MKKQILISLILLSPFLYSKAQIYTPDGTITGSSGNNNVGIGTTSTNSKLNVGGNIEFAATTSTTFRMKTNRDDNALLICGGTEYLKGASLQIYGGTHNSYPGSFYFVSGGNNANLNSIIQFGYRNTNGYQPKMTIKNNGAIGIGTENPGTLLQVIKSSGGNVSGLSIGSSVGMANLWGGASSGFVFDVTNGTLNGSIGADLYFRSGGSNTMVIKSNGNVAIYGKLEAKEIKVQLAPTADFVFNEDYELKEIHEVELFIKDNKHLPDFPSGKEVKENGINLGEMDAKLLQKIEELTLYIIEQNKEIDKLKETLKKNGIE